ncbi:MAG: sigma-70 family RNA polymerase sigma factor [Candidatus Latescibacterota bacterium]
MSKRREGAAEGGMEQAEHALIRQAAGGDARAFELPVRPYDRRILALALDVVRDADDAQDVYQEALLDAYRKLPGFRLDCAFSTWLYRIALNRALKFRRRRLVPQEESAAAQPADPGNSPEADLLAQELRWQLEAAMDGLSGRERVAFALCHRQGFRIEEAAACMGCSPGSVKSYLFRAREKVKTALQPYLEA